MTTTREQILTQIRSYAAGHGGRPPNMCVFDETTGISPSVWLGKYWAKWGDALEDAGFQTHESYRPAADREALDRLITLIQKLGHFPSLREIRSATAADASALSLQALGRLGVRAHWPSRVVVRCDERGGLDDVRQICMGLMTAPKSPLSENAPSPDNERNERLVNERNERLDLASFLASLLALAIFVVLGGWIVATERPYVPLHLAHLSFACSGVMLLELSIIYFRRSRGPDNCFVWMYPIIFLGPGLLFTLALWWTWSLSILTGAVIVYFSVLGMRIPDRHMRALGVMSSAALAILSTFFLFRDLFW